jgi:RHS repeat-associated protein
LLSTPPGPGGGNFTPIPGGGGFTPIPGIGSGGGGGGGGGAQQCNAPPGGATCGGSGPASQGNNSGVNTGAGNPINLTNGNKYQMEVDLPALPGELGVEIVRHYNSAQRHVLGQLGTGWRLSYETDLYVVGQTVQILQADGARLIFNIDPKNPTVYAGANPAQGWVEILAGKGSRTGGGKEYLWRWTHGEQAGRKLLFDQQGKLVRITAASGAVLSITRGPKGELLRVTDPQGRSLLFNHGGMTSVRQAEQAQRERQQQRQADTSASSGAGAGAGAGTAGLVASAPGLTVFTGIQSIDTPVGRFSYEHGISAASGAANTSAVPTSPEVQAQAQALVRAQAANLTQVSVPTHTDASQSAHAMANRPLSASTLKRRYHFEDARHPLSLTGISVVGSGSDGQVVDQRLSTFLYNAQGQALLSVRGEPARLQTDGTGQTVTPARLAPGTGIEQVYVQILRPALPGASTPGLSLLANSLGQRTVYRHQIVGGEYRLVEARGAGCAQCGPVNQRWGYDSLGRLVEQTVLAPTVIPESITAERLSSDPTAISTAISAALPPAVPLLTTRHILDAQGRTQRIEQVTYAKGKPGPAQLVERREYTDPRWPDKPTLLARASVVAGLEQTITLTYNEAGQVTTLKESGFSPLNALGEVATSAAQASRIERVTAYTFERINGRSLLVVTDGPLPNGPKNSPEDSDITRFEWDARGSFVMSVTTPGALKSEIAYDPASGQVQRVVNDAGFATTFTLDARQLLVRISSQGPGWAQPQVQSFQFDALGQMVQSFEGDATLSEAAANDSATGTPRATLRQAFDAQGRPLWRASALGMLQTWQHDLEGQPVQTSRLSNRIVQSEQIDYDALGRPTAWRDNAGRGGLLRYGSDGLPAAYQDALGRQTDLDRLGPLDSSVASPRTPEQNNTPRRALQLGDDFGHNVFTRSANTGTTLRAFDSAGRLVAMADALGNTARYTFDAQGRILRQSITAGITASATDARSQASASKATTKEITTEWRYAGRHLIEVIHPTQSERFEVDARGLRTARIVTLNQTTNQPANTPQGALTSPVIVPVVSVTRYEHDARGQLVATTLPDGSRLLYQRNGQDQVVALVRQTIQTPWLRWLGTEQIVAKDFQRDLVGLSSYTTGNGIEAMNVRSAEGALARTVYRHTTQQRPALQARARGSLPLFGRSTQETIERLLGIAPAHAQAVPTSGPVPASPANDQPGALGLPADPQALIDHRYLWSAGGHLLLSQQRAGRAGEQTQHSHAYDAQGRLVASVQAAFGQGTSPNAMSPISLIETAPQTQPNKQSQELAVWRYAYDTSQRRILSQHGAENQADLATGTQRSQFQDGSHRLQSMAGQGASVYNTNGQPERVGSREYVWDALGRLVEVREEANSLAQYQYDHRGLRISKAVGRAVNKGAQNTEFTQFTLYDESRQPLAELNAQGQIQRQYIWLADLPLAVIDTPQGIALGVQRKALQQVWADVQQIASGWLSSNTESLVWLHTNHLGAPEAATDSAGQIVWRASYAPFGAATLIASSASAKDAVTGAVSDAVFQLNLRLPGQTFDPETGLHYNRQRYYDPQHGQYLTPDPLGTPDGPNPYAYVAFNPLTNIDPDGLILFAFDGTGNDESDRALFSNVVRFRDLYASDEGLAFYITGPGTEDPRSGIQHPWYQGGNLADAGASFTGRERIAFLINDLRRLADGTSDETVIDIDVVGFSRGAAQARDFANQVAGATRNNWYEYTNAAGARQCQRVNLRFMGLFDTVLSVHRGSYNLGIPEAFSHVAHAVAMNEYRNLFPGESIAQGQFSSVPVPGQVRIERGFLGAHSDIGGSFADGDLAKVALVWMVNQATAAGVQMNALSSAQTTIIPNPVIHDSSSNLFASTGPAPTSTSEDRVIRFRDGSTPRQRTALVGTGTGYQDTIPYITYSANPRGNVAGTVDMNGYLQWLNQNGYGINMTVQ